MNDEKQEKHIANLVVWFLGITGLVLSVGVIGLTYFDKKIDGGLFGLAGTTVGALGAILTQAYRQHQQANQRKTDGPLEVVNPPGEPLEVQSTGEDSVVGEDSTLKISSGSPSSLAHAVQTNRRQEAARVNSDLGKGQY